MKTLQGNQNKANSSTPQKSTAPEHHIRAFYAQRPLNKAITQNHQSHHTRLSHKAIVTQKPIVQGHHNKGRQSTEKG